MRHGFTIMGPGLVESSGSKDKGECNPDRGPETGGQGITRWRFATGEVGGGPLKNRGGRKAALERGWWHQGLTARPAISLRSHRSGAERRGSRGANSTRQRGGVEEVGEVRGEGTIPSEVGGPKTMGSSLPSFMPKPKEGWRRSTRHGLMRSM